MQVTDYRVSRQVPLVFVSLRVDCLADIDDWHPGQAFELRFLA